MLRNFRFDLVSFILGFAAAALLGWLISRIRPLLPIFRAAIKKTIQNIRQRNLEGADHTFRQETLRRAQAAHLASALFSLDEILLEPRLLAPPPQLEPGQPPPQEAIASETIPYLPDWPELAAGHSAATFDLCTALQKGCSIALIGQPGSGKSVALAALASRMARSTSGLGNLTGKLPIFLHILDLSIALPDNKDPLPALLKTITGRAAMVYQKQLVRLLSQKLKENQAILLLDGLDELPASALQSAGIYLKALREKYPGLQIAAAASPYQFPGLAALELVPIGMAAWGAAHREEFLQRWSRRWAENIAPRLDPQQPGPVAPALIDNWLQGETGFTTPLEWTLKLWGAYAGDLRPAPHSSMATWISRYAVGLTTSSAVEALAKEFIRREQAALPYSDLAKFLTAYVPSSPVFVETAPAGQSVELEPPQNKARSNAKRDMILTVGEEILEKLVKGGFLVEHQGGLIRFAHPAALGYLAGRALDPELTVAALRNPYWSSAHQALRFQAACADETYKTDAGDIPPGADAWIDEFLRSEDTPLQRPLLAAARWLADGKPNAPWKAQVFRHLLAGVQNEAAPLSQRARMITAFVCSGDPVASRLFKQLLSAPMPVVRMLALLGAGALGDAALVADITAALADPVELVRNAACLGLVSLNTETSLNAVADVLMHGDERARQAAAESLVFLPGQGADIIREAAKVPDLLTRRAAVFGLLQLREAWSKQLLEQIAVEDAQWVVRNAAAQALEALQSEDPRVPASLVPPHNSPWLTGFAGKRNLGLSPYQPATDVLLQALDSDDLSDQLAALPYLRPLSQESVIRAVYSLLSDEEPALRNAARDLVWYWQLDGVPLPAHK